jgi:hypothetical protein
MSEYSSGDDIAGVLARAFTQVCERHLEDEGGPITERAARSLKHQLVSLVKDGARDERSLTVGGLIHLWLGDDEPSDSASSDDGDILAQPSEVATSHPAHFNLGTNQASARFLRQLRLPSTPFHISADVLALGYRW